MSSNAKKKISDEIRLSRSASNRRDHRSNELRPSGKSTAPGAELALLREKITDLVSKHPEKAAVILAGWLSRPARGRKTG